ncbi:MAG: cytochrome P450 [Rhodoluna sp.]
MPSGVISSLYFGFTKAMMKALNLFGDPIGKFSASPDLLTFAKRLKKTAVQKSITGILFSSDHLVCSEVMKSSHWLSRPLAERLYLATGTSDPQVVHPFLDSIIALDGPDQRRIKKVMHTVFTSNAIDSWRESSEKIVQRLIDEVRDKKEFDFVEAFANPLPLEVICEIIGVPEDYKEQCNQWGRALGGIGLDLPTNNKELRELEEAATGLTSLIAQLLNQRKKEPKEDLLSVMLAANSDGEILTDKEVIASAAFTLIAGFETTMNLLSVGTLALLEHPDQARELVQNPSLLSNFLEEALRVSSPIQFTVRTADTEQILPDGTVAKKGQSIILNLAAANRDPKIFEDPDNFDIHRSNSKKNVSFGFGAHHCIGSLLARVEAEVMWRELLKAFPDTGSWKLMGKPIYRSSKTIRSLDQLLMKF